MIPQVRNPLAGLLLIQRGRNIYKMQAPAEVLKNVESVAVYITITSQKPFTRKSWNYRQLARLKYWHNIFQYYQMGQLFFHIEGGGIYRRRKDDVRSITSRRNIRNSIGDKLTSSYG